VRDDSVCWLTGQEAGLGGGLGHCIRLLRGIGARMQGEEEYSTAKLVVQEQLQVRGGRALS
jgi:hypothetical protein